MSEPTQPTFDVRGAVDLSALTRPQSPPPGEDGGAPAAAGYLVDVTGESCRPHRPALPSTWTSHALPRPRSSKSGPSPTRV